MGGVGMAGRGDPSALYTNPAGLGYYTSSEISGGLNLLFSRGESIYQIFTDGQSSQQTGKTSSVQLGHLAGVYNAGTNQGSLVFALGVNRTAAFGRQLPYGGQNAASSITDTFLPSDVNDEYEITSESIDIFPVVPFVAFQSGAIEFFESLYQNEEYPFLQAVAPGRRVRQEGDVTRGGSINEINFAGAIEVAPAVMIGGEVNVLSGEYDFEHELKETDLEGSDNYAVIAGNTLLEDFNSVFFRTQFTSKLSGVNLRGGLSAELTDDVRFGFTVESPTWYSISEEYADAFIRTTFANGTLAYGDEDSEDEARGQLEYRMRTPWRLGTGISYRTNPIVVSADVEFVNWSQSHLRSSDDTVVFENVNDTFQDKYSYIFNWRAGAEYRFDEGLRLRIGGAYRPDPRTFDITFANGNEEDRSRLYFSAGAGFEVSDRFTLDLAWMQERKKDQFVPYPSVVPPAESEPIANPVVDENVVRNQFQVGLRCQL
jgi:long-subunit fatty acid transport protein